MASSRSSKRRRVDSKLNEEASSQIPAPGKSTGVLLPKAPEPGKKSPVVVFAHGAGAPSSSQWMIRWKEKLGRVLQAVEVVTFDYPYISHGKRAAPPKAEKLVKFHLEVVKKAAEKYPGHPVVLAGKSMGSRVSCMVACEDIEVSAIICLGYPLKGINGAIRDDTLLQLSTPVIFVQGSKDGLCPLDKLRMVQKKMQAPNELHVVEGGDHSLKVGKKALEASGSSQDQLEEKALCSIKEFVTKHLELDSRIEQISSKKEH